MRRLIVQLGVFGVLVLVLLVTHVSPFGTSQDTENTETTTITDYRVASTIAASGDMDVTETIDVLFPSGGKHGIFRYFDTHDASDARVVRRPERIRVLRDGEQERVQSSWEDDRRFRVLKIGDPFVTLTPGVHTYEISYRVPHVLTRVEGDRAGYYWNVVPGGWDQPIDRATITTTFPGPVESSRCVVGWRSGTPCLAQADESGTALRVEVSDLPARTPVTVQATSAGAPSEVAPALPWSVRWQPLLGAQWWAPLLALLLLVPAGLLGARLAGLTKEKAPGFGLRYTPPPGVGPAQAAYLLTERPGRKEAFIGNLMFAAANGWVRMERSGSSWTVTGNPEVDWNEVDPVTAAQVTSLGIAGGRTFTATPRNIKSGEVLSRALTAAKSQPVTWARREGLVERAGLGAWLWPLVLVAVGLYVLCGFLLPVPALAALVPAAFAASALPGLTTRAMSRRTATGREQWAAAGGFRRTLATPSAVDRFDFSGREELYTAYIPWAVAFGCAEEWAAKYRSETGTPAPEPAYLVGAYTGAGQSGGAGSMVDSFSTAVTSSISSYQASQSSSDSGGGGGFSGGGGGGGGGGGSW